MTGKNVVKTIKEMLKEFDIKTGKMYKTECTETQRSRYRFYISGKNNLEKFRNKIGFNNPIQKERLSNLLSKYWKYQTEEFRSMVVSLLRKNDEMNIFELSKRLNRKSISSLRNRLTKLEKEIKN